MTALQQYERLESPGLWRADAGAQRLDVIVSFGDATLVISDGAGRPLTHWSLPAVCRNNPGTRPAVFTPAPNADETLEIDEAVMIDAIETVRKSVHRGRATPGRLRWVVRLGLIGAVIGGIATFGPRLLKAQTLSVISTAQRGEIGAAISQHLQTQLGQTCHSTKGRAALDALQMRLLGDGGHLTVLPTGLGLPVALPGGAILLDRHMVEDVDDPLIVAGQILATQSARLYVDPLKPVLDHAGTKVVLELYTTGNLPEGVLESYAATLPKAPRSFPPVEVLQETFKRAQVLSTPYYAFSGFDVSASAPQTTKPVLTDGQWVALQGICLN